MLRFRASEIDKWLEREKKQGLAKAPAPGRREKAKKARKGRDAYIDKLVKQAKKEAGINIV